MTPNDDISAKNRAAFMLKEALVLHQKGQLAEASALYHKILKRSPGNAAAANLLGVINAQRRNHLAAITLFDRAIRLCPTNAVFFYNRGNAFKDMKRFNEALSSYDRALVLKPDYAKALNNRGIVLKELKRFDEALGSFNRAVRLKSDDAEALYNRGTLLRELTRFDEALASLNRALAIAPDCDAFIERGIVLESLKRFDEAVVSYDRALVIRPDHAEGLINRGNALSALKRFDEALASYNRALAMEPDDAKVLNNRGNALKDLNRLDEALASYDRALAIKPDYVGALCNRATVLRELKRVNEALTSCDRALSISPDYVDALFSRGCIQLLCGDYRNGFAGYEWRWETKEDTFIKRPKIDATKWQGEDIAGRRILVFAEQGLGDVIQFARYLLLLIKRGAEVTFLCPPKLIRLLRPLSAEISFVTSLVGQGSFDFQCALMSLPTGFGTDLGSIPREIPYLTPEGDLVDAWRKRIGAAGFKIGVAWQGNPDGKVDRGRSFSLSELIPLARRHSVRLISLQKTYGLDQLAKLPADTTIETLGDGFDAGPDAFVDTAAVMSSLDLIITSDTSIAHLAGALGRPTWVALQYVPDWRWLLNRSDSPWYPTMRLFRQQTPGEWGTVFQQMMVGLNEILSRD